MNPAISRRACSLVPAVDPLVSVIIASHNREEMLSRAVTAVAAQDLPDEYELVVVDDASTDGTPDRMLRLLEETTIPVTYLRLEANSGPAVGRNAGLAVAQGRFIAFTDDDCVQSPGWLRAALDAFQSPKTGMVQGRTLPARPTSSFLSRHVETRGVDGTFATANIVYRREALEGQLFDPACSWGQWEDMDLGWRVLEQGWEVCFAPQALVKHEVLSMTRTQWVMWPWHYFVWCANTARHPGFRRHLFLGLWVRPMHLLMDLAVAGMLASRWRRSAALLALPYAVAFVRIHNVRGRSFFTRVLLYLARDAVAFVCLRLGSVRHRAVVL